MLALAALVACEDGDPQPTEGSFSVLTCNVKSPPPEIAGYDTDATTAQIGAGLAAFQVVGLQEGFDEARHQGMAGAAGHPTSVWFNDTADSDRFYGSGLSVLSEFAAADGYSEHFEQCYGTLDNTSDCLASKGFQVVRLEVNPGVLVLEAGGGEEDDLARLSQIDQLVEAMNGWSADRPLILLGDTNLHPDEAAELAVIEDWMARAGLSDTCAAGCDEPDHIDRIWFRDGGGLRFTVQDWANQDAAFQDADGQPLSDHEPLSAVLGWDLE